MEKEHRKLVGRRCIAGLLLATLSALAHAGCARVLQVPVAPIGLAVTVVGGKVGGIYPDLLRSLAAKDGCKVAFPVVPRARQEMLFETGQADLLMPARRSARRDEHGVFVPLLRSRAALVSLPSERPAVRKLAELRKRRELRVVVVRGYDYGSAYQALLKELGEQGRLSQVADPISMARMLDGGLSDLAIVTPTILTGALREDAKLQHLLPRLRYEPVEELPWGESGVYVSNKSSLSAQDRALVQQLLERLARSGAAWRSFQRYFPDDQLTETVKPR